MVYEEQIMDESPKLGRPRKERDAAKIWSEEQGELAEIARDIRKFFAQQLEELKKEAAGITSTKQRLEVATKILSMHGELTKNIKSMMTETQKEPREQDETVDLDKIYKDLMK